MRGSPLDFAAHQYAADHAPAIPRSQSSASTSSRARGGGKVFAYRYGAKQIKTKSYARNALSYVLNNWRRHREDFFDGAARKALLDEYSSAVSFDGWTVRFGAPPPEYEPLPVSPPRSTLLRFDWSEFGRIDPQERPGPLF